MRRGGGEADAFMLPAPDAIAEASWGKSHAARRRMASVDVLMWPW